ncbi:MAG: hypothetical protein IPM69_02500 [Ignavibacteria bacterium]|nr:hypothetical protein [Ignavibacteria bacterium]
MIKLFVLSVLFLGVLSHTSSAQNTRIIPSNSKAPFTFPEIQFGAGLTTFYLNGDNSARDLIYPKDTIRSIGGGISGSQPGIAVRATFILDAERKFRVVAGFDYMILVGQQRIEASGFSFYAKHSVSIPSAVLGFEYAFAELPLAKAKTYAGIDIRNTFISGKFNKTIAYTNFKPFKVEEEEFTTKESVSRLGLGLRIGVEGELSPPITINMSAGYTSINLFNPNTSGSRGQLLTPSVTEDFDRVERVIGNLSFTMMVQFKF